MKKKIMVALVIATLLVGIITATSAHSMRGIEFTIDQPNPKPVITIITPDNGSYTFENENSQRLLCPFGLVRIILELDKAIKNNVTSTQNNWRLIKWENNNSNEMSEDDDEEALEEEEEKEEKLFESKVNAREHIKAIRAAVMKPEKERRGI